MSIVKILLTLFSIVIVLGSIVAVVYVYRDNLAGLVLPPQIESLVIGGSSGSQFLPQFQPPQATGQSQYNPETGTFTYPFNFTNPLTNKITINQQSGQVVTQNNVYLGNISIDHPITVKPGQTVTINAFGNLSQDAINQLKAQDSDDSKTSLALENLNVNVGGVNVHIDRIDAGSILMSG